MSNFTAIDHKGKFADFRQIRRQLAHKRQVKPLALNPFNLHPTIVAFDLTPLLPDPAFCAQWLATDNS
jgi:hypothetical protein